MTGPGRGRQRHMEIRQTILQAIDAAAGELVDLARRIHATPEIAFQEVQASQWLCGALERHAFAVQRDVADLPTAFRAERAGGPGGPSLASYRLKVKFLGKAAHAAAAPYEGINALDGLVQMFVNIGLLRQQLRDDARVHGIITYGGAAPNIIPDRAEAAFSVRAADSAYAAAVLEKVINCGRAGAAAKGATFEHETQKGYDAMNPNRPLADAFGRHLQELGWAVDLPPQRQRMGSTDMGDVSQIIPSVHPYLAIGKNIGGHTVEFREAALTDRAFQAMLTAAKTMALTGLDVMTDSAFLEQVRSDFSAGVKS